MMRTPNAVILEWHLVGDVTTGGWCQPCALPSVLSWVVALHYARTLHRLKRCTMTRCDNCQRHTAVDG